MPQILETKVHCDDLVAVRHQLRALGATQHQRTYQRDTYFRVPTGWLKLRLTDNTAHLIAYQRHTTTRSCDYVCLTVGHAEQCRSVFTALLGTLVDVSKIRELWTLDSTTIHLDTVNQLGDFIELETDHQPNSSAPHEHQRLISALNLADSQDITTSYADLLIARTQAHHADISPDGTEHSQHTPATS